MLYAGLSRHFARGKPEKEKTSLRLHSEIEPVTVSSVLLRPRGALFTATLRARIFHLIVCVAKNFKSFTLVKGH